MSTPPEKQSKPRAYFYEGPHPEEGDLDYIIRWLFEAGPFTYEGMGPAPLDWKSIESWQNLMGLSLEPKEVIALRHLSFAFVDQQSKSKDAKCPPPWVDPEQIDREKVSDKVTKTFKEIIKRRKKRSGGSRQNSNRGRRTGRT